MKNPVFIFALVLFFTLRLFCGGNLFPVLTTGLLFFAASLFRALALKRTKYSRYSLAAGFAVAFGCFLAVASGAASSDRLAAFEGRECEIEGVVLAPAQKTDYGYSYEIETRKITLGEKSYIRRAKGILYLDEKSLAVFDRIEGTAQFKNIRGPSDEGIDIYRASRAKGILFRASAKEEEFDALENVGAKRPIGRLSLAFVQRAERIFSQKLGEEEGSVLLGIVTGRKEAIHPALLEMFRRTSLSHVLSVSGMHLSYLVALILLILKNKNKLLTLLVLSAALLFYAFVAGFTPSVLRSAVMTLILIVSQLLGREYDPRAALGAAAVFILTLNPFSVYDLGLLLSFSSVLGIVTFAKPVGDFLRRPLAKKGERAKKALGFLLESVAISLAVLPFSAVALLGGGMGVFLLSPVVNLLCVFTMPFLFVGGILLAGLGNVPVIAEILSGGLTLLIRYVAWIVAAFSKLGYFIVDKRTVLMILWLIYVAALFSLYFFFRWKNKAPPKNGMRKILVAISCALVFVLALKSFFPQKIGGVEVAMLDVGQGQCVLILTDGVSALLDCGSTTSGKAADAVLEEYLRRRSVQNLEIAVLSHFHADHAGGMPKALVKGDVQKLILPPGESEKTRYEKELLSASKRTGTSVTYADADLFVRLAPDVTLYILSGHIEEGSSENEQNAVALLCYNDSEFLFMGDLDRGAERRFVDYFDESAFKTDIDVLQVGHHGSKYASGEELLALTTPEIALISAGKGNPYGHPTKEAIGRLSAAGARVLTTIENGTIALFTAGDGTYALQAAGGN